MLLLVCLPWKYFQSYCLVCAVYEYLSWAVQVLINLAFRFWEKPVYYQKFCNNVMLWKHICDLMNANLAGAIQSLREYQSPGQFSILCKFSCAFRQNLTFQMALPSLSIVCGLNFCPKCFISENASDELFKELGTWQNKY